MGTPERVVNSFFRSGDCLRGLAVSAVVFISLNYSGRTQARSLDWAPVPGLKTRPTAVLNSGRTQARSLDRAPVPGLKTRPTAVLNKRSSEWLTRRPTQYRGRR